MSEELKALKKQLLKDDRNGYDVLSAAELEKMEAYCTVYKAFLDAGKTERLSARTAIALAEKHGFVAYKRGMSLSAGDKVKVMIMFRGREQSRPEAGVRLLQRLAAEIGDLATVESMPRQDGRNMTMVLAPTKRKADALTEQRKRREAERAERRGKRAERASKDQARVAADKAAEQD